MPKPKKPRTVDEVGNQFGYLCPSCGRGDRLIIAAWTNVLLTREGTGTTDAGYEWDQDSPARCRGCNWRGQVHELKEVEVAFDHTHADVEHSQQAS